MADDVRFAFNRPVALALAALAIVGWLSAAYYHWQAANVRSEMEEGLRRAEIAREGVAADLQDLEKAAGNAADLKKQSDDARKALAEAASARASAQDDLAELTLGINKAKLALSAARDEASAKARDLNDLEARVRAESDRLATLQEQNSALAAQQTRTRAELPAGQNQAKAAPDEASANARDQHNLLAEPTASGAPAGASTAPSGQSAPKGNGAGEPVESARTATGREPAAAPGEGSSPPPERGAEAAPPVQPTAGPQAGPPVENPAQAQTSPVQPTAEREDEPRAESSAKTETPPLRLPPKPEVAPVAQNPAKTETPSVQPPAEPEAKPVDESLAKTETPPARPSANPSVETQAEAHTARVQRLAEPEAEPVAEPLAKAETPSVRPPPEPAARPLAESAERIEAPAPAGPAKPEAVQIPEGSAKPETPPAKTEPNPAGDAAKPEVGAASGSGAGTADGAATVAAIVPPRAPQAALSLGGATVDKDFVADLPPFSDPGDAKGITLRVEPRLPEGLAFVDLGSGFGEISGKPAKAGQFAFEVVATNGAGGSAQMTTRIAVAPAAPEPKPPPSKTDADNKIATLEPADNATNLLRGFDGGPCFLVRVRGDSRNSFVIDGVGSDKEPFQRFYASFIHDVGIEPTLTVTLIAPAQCPAVELIAAARATRAAAPTIELAASGIARGKPLAGTIGALAGRNLDLLLISNDGFAYEIEHRGATSERNERFSVPITPDANSTGALQIVLAIASPKQLDALVAFRSGAAADILPKIAAQIASSDAALEAAYFKFLK